MKIINNIMFPVGQDTIVKKISEEYVPLKYLSQHKPKEDDGGDITLCITRVIT